MKRIPLFILLLAWLVSPAFAREAFKDAETLHLESSVSAQEMLKRDVALAQNNALTQSIAKETAAISSVEFEKRTLSPIGKAVEAQVQAQPRPRMKARASQPAKIVTGNVLGKDYVHGGSEINCIMQYVQDTENANMIHIHNFYGLEETVDAVVDLTAGTVSILPQRILQSPTYGDVFLFPVKLEGDKIQYFPTTSVTGTIDENGVITLGTWGAIVGQGQFQGQLLALLDKSEYVPCNATMTATKMVNGDGSTIEFPLLIEQANPSEIKIYNFGTTAVPVTVRVFADNTVSVSEQFIAQMGLYGDFHTFPIDIKTSQIKKDQPIMGTIDTKNSTISFDPWVAGSIMQDGLVALYLVNSKVTSQIPLTAPKKLEFNLEGKGTATSPYLIKTVTDLLALSQNSQSNSFPGLYFRLETDLDLKGVTEFLPIGSSKAAFNGYFDGNNHRISNLTINGVGYHFQGLFGAIYEQAQIKNLTLENAALTGSGYYLGLIAGYSQGSISNCHATGSIATTGMCVGGIVGRTYGSVEGCSFSGTANACGYIGGIAGYSYGAIRNCESDGNIALPQRLTNGAACVGGIAGLAQSFSIAREGVIADCLFSGTVTQGSGYGFAGGIAGYIYAVDMDRCLNTGLVLTTSTTGTDEATGGICGLIRDSYIDDCLNVGYVESLGTTTFVGGLIGYLNTVYTGGTGLTEPLFVKNCLNAGQVKARNLTTEAGIFGDEFKMEQFNEKPSDTAFTNVYADNQIVGRLNASNGSNSSEFIGKLPKGFDSAVWTANTNGYPTLKVFDSNPQNKVAQSAIAFAEGESTRAMKKTSTLQAPTGVTWTLLTPQSLKLEGDKLQLGTVYANDTIAAMLNGKLTGRRLVINTVPKLFAGEGTSADPFQIKDKADFMTLHDAVMHYDHAGDCFLQTADVDFGNSDDFAGVAAGNHLKQFAGTFDGGNHLIKNLKIKSANLDAAGNTLAGTYNYGGLFHIGTPESVIKNVVIDSSCSFNFYGSAGAVIGYTQGKVLNCRNYADIQGVGDRVGGIVGYLEEGSELEDCYNSGTITSTANYTGGIAGFSIAKISASQNDGEINGGAKYTGGIVGASGGSVANSINSATITGADYIGGIIGSNVSGYNMGDVINCVSSGMVNATGEYIGGVVGYSNGRGKIEGNYFDASINNMDGCSSLSQGFNGVSTSELVTDQVPEALKDAKYSFSKTSYPSIAKFAEEPKGKTTRNIFMLFAKGQKRTNIIEPTPLSTASALEWKLKGDSIFKIKDGALTVDLLDSNLATDTLTAVSGDITKIYSLKAIKAILEGSGSKSSPFLITSHEDITTLADFMKESEVDYEGYYFRVENNIEYPDTVAFVPVALTGAQFQGHFDGNGKTISGLSFVDETTKTGKYVGFFGVVGSKATISNLTLSGAIKGNSYAGGFAGKLYGAIDNCVSKVKVDGKSGYDGGFAGYMYDGASITNSTFEGVVGEEYDGNYNYAAGFAGQTDLGSTIDNCINKGTIGKIKNTSGTTWTGPQYVGGFVGWLNGTVSNCRNEGTLNGRMNVGGITGRLGKTGKILDCANTVDITIPYGSNLGGMAPNTQGSGLSYIIRCYNTGNLKAKGYVAGIIGQITNGVTVDSCYNTGNISGYSSTSYGVGGVIGQMASSTAYPSEAKNSWNSGDIYNESQSTGGFAGKITGGVAHDCYNTGNVKVVNIDPEKSTPSGVGGFAGCMNAEVYRVWNSGNVEADIYGVGGLIGVGAMPIAIVSECVNYGNVKGTNFMPEKGWGIGGIWGGYGPVTITDCVNFGTVTGPDYVAGINPALHSNSNGGTTILRSYNAGALIVPDTAKKVSNVALLSEYVDTRNPIDPALMRVDSTYFNASSLKEIEGDSIAVGLKRLALHKAALGDAYTYRTACLPVPAFADSLALSDFYAADIELEDENSDATVDSFKIGQLPNVSWSATEGLEITADGEVKVLKSGTHTLTVTSLNTPETLTRTYTVKVTASGVDSMEQDAKEIASIEYYTLNGVRIAAPEINAPCIARISYVDGTTATKKLLITK